ncbi:hypothetical protein [uncultured Ferrimonas sp.]|uniref:hypothetical protein n=1 Tax=uncultured Ferrimonas sp. TaxID=432640 RepID=UPI00261D4C84|nr:hypothetical protein [uncultured Ferrimonas sp.]
MTIQQHRWAFVGALLVLIAVVVLLSPPPIAQPSGAQLASYRSATFAEGVAKNNGLVYVDRDRFHPLAQAPTELDINVLLRDFPTAAGAIHGQVLAQQQYLAASEGNYEQAMRLMGQSFITANGGGSYAVRW